MIPDCGYWKNHKKQRLEPDMQHRMKTRQLTEEQIKGLLLKSEVGCLTTLNADGTPYVTPIHFLYKDGLVYFHGLPKGQKIANIQARPEISMTVYQMEELMLDQKGQPCDTNTKYQSVVLSGLASIIEDLSLKKEILTGIVAKYTPALNAAAMSDAMIKATAVVEIKCRGLTGKYYD